MTRTPRQKPMSKAKLTMRTYSTPVPSGSTRCHSFGKEDHSVENGFRMSITISRPACSGARPWVLGHARLKRRPWSGDGRPRAQARLYAFCPTIGAGEKRDRWSRDSKTERASGPVVASSEVCRPCPVCGRPRGDAAPPPAPSSAERPRAGGGGLKHGGGGCTSECAKCSRGPSGW